MIDLCGAGWGGTCGLRLTSSAGYSTRTYRVYSIDLEIYDVTQ